MENSKADRQFVSFENLECWRKCRETRNFIFELTKKYPKEELYALTQNTRRASYSITSNIAEGYGRFHYQENIQFCRQSRGSLYELQDQLIIANDNGYINSEQINLGRKLISDSIGILNGYINFLIKEQEKGTNKKTTKTIFNFLFSIF